MIYKAFAGATLMLALMVALLADRFAPSRDPTGGYSTPATVAGEVFSFPDAPPAPEPVQEDAALYQDTPAYGQPMPGADAPFLSPGNGLPESVQPAASRDEDDGFAQADDGQSATMNN